MTELAYRPVAAADLPFIMALVIADSVVDTGDDPTAADPAYRRALAEIDQNPNEEMWIAEDSGVPVGCFQLSFTPGLLRRGAWRATIELVHIVPERRNGGLGGQLIGFAIERCRARHCDIVQLTSNKQRTDAHRFYERLGFARSHEGFKLYL